MKKIILICMAILLHVTFIFTPAACQEVNAATFDVVNRYDLLDLTGTVVSKNIHTYATPTGFLRIHFNFPKGVTSCYMTMYYKNTVVLDAVEVASTPGYIDIDIEKGAKEGAYHFKGEYLKYTDNSVWVEPLYSSKNIKVSHKKVAYYQYAASVTLNRASVTLKKGKTCQLKSTVKPKTANPGVTWKSSAPSIASVNSNGKVTAKKKGKATITCTLKDGSGLKKSCVFNITN